MRTTKSVAVPAALVALLAAAAGPAESSPTHVSAARGKAVVVSTRNVRGLGTILVDAKGRTLYMFVPDRRRRVTCVKVCAKIWPPLFLPKGGHAVARGKARKALLSSDRDPAGGRVVTYARWPLYLYVADTKPGMAKGQALDLNGGLWYVLDPAGRVIRTKMR
jgi:predicted lipoprotein with Yx(FWY)xxD motif